MRRWLRPPLVGDNTHRALPAPLRGLELLAPADRDVGIVRDRSTGTTTAVLRVRAHGFPLAATGAQDATLAAWGTALSPFAREGAPVRQIIWQEWSHPVTGETHRAFSTPSGSPNGAQPPGSRLSACRAIPGDDRPRVLIAVTVDERKVRSAHCQSRLATAVDCVARRSQPVRRTARSAGLDVDGPLSPLEFSAAVRVRSDRAPHKWCVDPFARRRSTARR